MGSAQSQALPHVVGFGETAGGLDRSRVHDVPWFAALRDVGDVDEAALEELVRASTDVELHCSRALFRAYRQLMADKEEWDEATVELCQQLYFVVAQSPSVLVIFYSMLHRAALLGVTAEELEPLPPDVPLVAVAVACYAAEKHMPVSGGRQADAVAGTASAMRNVITTYVDEMRDLLQNPAFADAQVESVELGGRSCNVYTLRPWDGSIEARVCDSGATVLSVRLFDEGGIEREEVIATDLPPQCERLRAANSPENSSSSKQVFYSDSLRVEVCVEEGRVLLVRYTSSADPVSFQCGLARPAVKPIEANVAYSTLQFVGSVEGVGEVWLANARLRIEGTSLVVDKSANFLLKVKF